MLGRRINLLEGIDWNKRYFSPLFTYHLNYFDYALSLGKRHQKGSKKAYPTFKKIASSFIREARPGISPGWEPYPLATRIVNWLLALSLFDDALADDEGFLAMLLSSIHHQLAFLLRNLEYHLSGNHLIRNAKALAIGGACFPGRDGEKWLKEGVRLLTSELKKQVFPDGGHKEGSPHYHFLVLRDLLETLLVFEAIGYIPEEELYHLFGRMLSFLSSILLPDGTLPLFGDGERGDPAAINRLISTGEKLLREKGLKPPPNNNDFPHTGYYLHHTARSSIIIAGGAPPPHLSGHLHAHLLSYELIVDGRPIILDSGTGEYEGEELRDYFRGSSAHNTLVIEGKDQFELWACFRVARRARVIKGRVERGEDDGFLFAGAYQPYHSPHITHKREISYNKKEGWLIEDEVMGGYSLTAHSFIHLHPEVKLAQKGDDFLLQFGDNKITISPFGVGKTDIITGWYAPYFGVKTENQVIRLEVKLKGNTCFGYRIRLH